MQQITRRWNDLEEHPVDATLVRRSETQLGARIEWNSRDNEPLFRDDPILRNSKLNLDEDPSDPIVKVFVSNSFILALPFYRTAPEEIFSRMSEQRT